MMTNSRRAVALADIGEGRGQSRSLDCTQFGRYVHLCGRTFWSGFPRTDSARRRQLTHFMRRQFELPADPTKYRYELMADHLEERIKRGDLPPNTALPNERDLCVQYDVSLGTGRKVVRELRERGLVVTVRSKGTFVVWKAEDDEQHLTAEIVEMIPRIGNDERNGPVPANRLGYRR